MSETKKKPKEEASRVAREKFKGYCERKGCTEWATYDVYDKRAPKVKVGIYCRDCSEFLVHALNSIPAAVKEIVVSSLFPPL